MWRLTDGFGMSRVDNLAAWDHKQQKQHQQQQ